MKPSEIQELISYIATSGLDEVNIQTENFKLSVKKHSPYQYQPVAPAVQAPVQLALATPAPQATTEVAPAPVAAPPAPVSKSNTVIIKSPMIGTFYRSSAPDRPSLVGIGSEIKKGSPLCIIEAMKLFNEIESEISGKIVKILVENATPVEYDQPLFEVEPS